MYHLFEPTRNEKQDGSEFSELFCLTYYSHYFWCIAKKIKVGHIMSVAPHIFAPRNLKKKGKDMKQDKDLVFLASCQNDDLRTLCDILTYNNKGEIRLSEQLTDTDAYLNYYPDSICHCGSTI